MKKGKIIKCKFCNKEFSSLGIHTHIAIKHHGKKANCNFLKNATPWNKGLTKETNPTVKLMAEKTAKSIKGKPGHPHSEKSKKEISKKMKKAHAEGRAWNIGKSRWNNEPSYPEKFFKRVIANEIEDKNYIPEYPCGIYSIDFAWPERKLAFEIDGDQHQRFEEYKLRDQRKDLYLQKEGWKILRLVWKDVCNNTKGEIQKLKLFINASSF